VLIQYGAKDQIVAESEANDIYKAFSSEQKELVIYEDAFHELFLKRHPEKWRKEISEFLAVTDR
jgi:alpha-beta hydrolase superfamily lysophospholipase